jgi:hypothetical protein
MTSGFSAEEVSAELERRARENGPKPMPFDTRPATGDRCIHCGLTMHSYEGDDHGLCDECLLAD